MSFVKRNLGFTFQFGLGTNGAGGYDTITLPDGLWATVKITQQGGPAFNEANIRIFGMQQSTMNRLSRIGLQPAAMRNNIVTVTAGELGGNMPIAFVGGIKEAFPDFSNPTEAAMTISADTGTLDALKPCLPTSYAGSTNVVDIMQSLAKQMGYTLENNGVTGQLTDPYLPGSARDQAVAAAAQAGIYVYFENTNGVMSIVPMDSSRNTTAPTISPNQEMVGYPAYVGPGMISLKTEYNQNIKVLGNIVVKDSIVNSSGSGRGANTSNGANGTWRVMQLAHDLSTLPDGPWFTEIPLATNVAQ